MWLQRLQESCKCLDLCFYLVVEAEEGIDNGKNKYKGFGFGSSVIDRC